MMQSQQLQLLLSGVDLQNVSLTGGLHSHNDMRPCWSDAAQTILVSWVGNAHHNRVGHAGQFCSGARQAEPACIATAAAPHSTMVDMLTKKGSHRSTAAAQQQMPLPSIRCQPPPGTICSKALSQHTPARCLSRHLRSPITQHASGLPESAPNRPCGFPAQLQCTQISSQNESFAQTTPYTCPKQHQSLSSCLTCHLCFKSA